MENVQNVPIDIQTSKLLDWLVDRRHCNIKWQTSASEIRQKITAALRDMPEHQEIKALLAGSYIHYFNCVRIVEILKGTEASSKNFFGQYSSQRMKDWQLIQSMYEKDNVYLAEVASLLARSVGYEGPALRKQVAKAQQLQQELSRRETECQSSSSELRKRYYASCKQYGITGENVARELQALVKDLPGVLDTIGRDASKLHDHIQLYEAFTHFTCNWSEPVLPLLRFVQENGNASFYQWRKGRAPQVVERAVMEEAPPDTAVDDAIDWGDFGGSQEASYGIELEDGVDWGVSASKEEDGGIDWGDTGEAAIEIEVVEDGADCPEGVARGEDALSVLENPQSRTQFIDELMELETFLAQRLSEQAEEADVVSMSQFQLAPSLIQDQTVEHLSRLQSAVQDLLSRLTSLRMQHLFMILASPKYVERVSEMLRQKLKQADILIAKRALLAENRQKALEEQARLEPCIDQLAKTARDLQKLIEADISKRYNNRPVNLMGVNV